VCVAVWGAALIHKPCSERPALHCCVGQGPIVQAMEPVGEDVQAPQAAAPASVARDLSMQDFARAETMASLLALNASGRALLPQSVLAAVCLLDAEIDFDGMHVQHPHISVASFLAQPARLLPALLNINAHPAGFVLHANTEPGTELSTDAERARRMVVKLGMVNNHLLCVTVHLRAPYEGRGADITMLQSQFSNRAGYAALLQRNLEVNAKGMQIACFMLAISLWMRRWRSIGALVCGLMCGHCNQVDGAVWLDVCLRSSCLCCMGGRIGAAHVCIACSRASHVLLLYGQVDSRTCVRMSCMFASTRSYCMGGWAHMCANVLHVREHAILLYGWMGAHVCECLVCSRARDLLR